MTREPGAGEFGAKVRDLLLSGKALHPETELFLFLADRAEHVRAMVLPALNEGGVVLCDRHADSTIVYQGYGRGLPLDRIRELSLWATGGLKPDLSLLLDLSPELGLERVQSRLFSWDPATNESNRLDREPLEFHRRVREGFLAEAAREPQRWRKIDASAPAEQVAQECLTAIQERLRSRQV